ncbi:AI-2E family transporter [Flavilitoribacter nigricans]|nr:AI-2E family transporter [Flavilitoribacter nigricans]
MESDAKELSTFSIQRLAYFLIVVSILVCFLVIAQEILVPLTFAFFLSLMLKPLCDFFERHTGSEILAIILSLLSVLLPVALLVYFFSVSVLDVFNNLGSIGEKLQSAMDRVVDWFYDLSVRKPLMDGGDPDTLIKGLFDAPVEFLKSGLSSGTAMLATAAISLVYTFFFLLYRKGLKIFLLVQFEGRSRMDVKATIGKIQEISQRYLYGLGMVILIMGSLNSLGLYLIGIQYSLLWGFLAACLTVIPYIGTTLGGLLPFLYAIATTTTFWQPAAVACYYIAIQQIEGNFITPKVIGNSININPMIAILALIVGGYMWGMYGLILSLPVAATLRVICMEIDWLKPVALLMSNELGQRKDKFKWYNHHRFRLSSLFKIDTSRFRWRK